MLPKRRIQLNLNIGADNLTHLIAVLEEFADDLRSKEKRPGESGSSGGADHSTGWDLTEDPTMTPERYQTLLRQHLDQKKLKKVRE